MALGFGFSLPAYLGYGGGFGAGATLVLDFTSDNQTLDPRITFTRSSTATRTNASGVLVSEAINDPRFDYDPVTLAPKGLLIEESRTNLLLWSDAFDNAVWGKSGSTVTANAVTAPDGTLSADSVIEDATNSGHQLAQVVTANSTVAWTASFYVKAAGRSWATTLIDDNAGNGTRAYFNLSNGTVGALAPSGTTSGGSARIQAAGNGWYRCILTCVPSTVNANNVRVYVAGTTDNNVGTYTGTNALVSVHVWGGQLE